MANSIYIPQRIAPYAPLVRTHEVIAVQHLDAKKVTICKYLKRTKTGEKNSAGEDIWEDRVAQEWVSNPDGIDLRGWKIQMTSEIVQ